MIYGYIRVSTDKQDTANQRFEIERFCKLQKIKIGKWVVETISSQKPLDKRLFGKLLNDMQKGDMVIASEISRLGRKTMEVMSILHHCMQKEVMVWTIKDAYRLGNDIGSKVLAFAFSLSAEIERNLISQRIKESLARRKAMGIKLGRPIGSKKKNPILKKHAAKIIAMHNRGDSQIEIARSLNCHRHTVKKFIESL